MGSGEYTEGTILVVDQENDLNQYLTDSFDSEGHSLVSIKSAGECFSRITNESIDGIISAYSLPDMDGLQLLRAVRISFPNLPFVLVPEEGSERLAGEAIAAGVSGYEPKNGDHEAIANRLQESIDETKAAKDSAESASQERYRHLIDDAPVPINIFDDTGTAIWCNRAVLDLLDFDEYTEFIGESIFDVIDPVDEETARRELQTVVEDKESTGPTEMRLRTAESDVRHIRVSTAIGRFLGTDIGQAVAIDMTDREERKRQLQAINEWLRHNIRNEMSVIGGFAENIQKETTEDVKESATKIRNHADKLLGQANHARSVIELLTEPSESETIQIALDEVIEGQVANAKEIYPDVDIEVVDNESVAVQAIPDIEGAIWELIDNAIRHNDSNSPSVNIEISNQKSDDCAILRIADNGPGIPEIERRALDLNYEIDELHHGSGLGLMFVFWTIHLSDAEITFAENAPRGSLINVRLPQPSSVES